MFPVSLALLTRGRATEAWVPPERLSLSTTGKFNRQEIVRSQEKSVCVGKRNRERYSNTLPRVHTWGPDRRVSI